MKYSKEVKLECIRKYKDGEYIREPSNITHKRFMNQVRKWKHMYDSLGEAGLDHGRPEPTLDDKLKMIRLVEEGSSYTQVAESFGTYAASLIRWHKIYLEKGSDGLKYLKRGKRIMNDKKTTIPSDKAKEELIKEITYLKAENEYLKKLNALVQKRKAREQSKK